MFRLICILIGYFIGCIQTAFFVGKVFHTDLSKKGSGNLGTTNALRVLGVKAGLITFVGDILKAVISFLIGMYLYPEQALLAGIYGGVGAVLGHDFPFYLKFKGGKGIAAGIGIVLCIGFTTSLPTMLISFAIGIVAVKCSSYISLGSVLFSIAVPICGFLFDLPLEAVVISAALAALAVWRHRANIQRLLAGNENKFSFPKRG